MATTKPTFAKLKLQKNIEKKVITFNDFEIEVKQYLPIQDKMSMINKVINNSLDENNFANPVKIEMFGTLEIIYTYSNISFTDKQKGNSSELYDILISSGLADQIIQNIPSEEYSSIITWINECVKAYYDYTCSILGIMENVTSDYKNLDLNAAKIQQELSDPNNMELLRNILSKLG